MPSFTVHTIDLKFQGINKVIASYLVDWSGGLILVEPGPYSTFPRLRAELSELGYSVSDITDVFVTHVHFDHAGAAWAFAKTGASIHVHPKGKRHLANPEKLWSSAARIYGEAGMTSLWGEMQGVEENQLVEWQHKESQTIAGLKFTAHHSPGHAKHHIAWQIEDCMFLGDVGGIKIGKGPVEPPCPPPDIDVEAWKASLEHLLSVKKITAYYLTHFGEVPALFEDHCSALVEKLTDWATFIYKNRDMPLDQLTSSFENKVSIQRKSSQETYMLANPPMVSVSGLLRYWTLKS